MTRYHCLIRVCIVFCNHRDCVQVRKSGHSTLFSLLEHQLIGSGLYVCLFMLFGLCKFFVYFSIVDVEHFMVPVLAQMTTADNCMSQLEAARVSGIANVFGLI